MEQIERELASMLLSKRNGSVILIGPGSSGKTKLLNRVLGNGCTDTHILRLDGLVSADYHLNLHRLLKFFKTDVSLHFEELADVLLSQHAVAPMPFTVIVIEWLEEYLEVNQQLLYGLLDLCTVLPLLVIGVSRRVDVVEGMEKRVRSRFSQNILFMPTADSQPTFGRMEYKEFSIPELLVLVAVARLHEKHKKLTSGNILQEYYFYMRSETESSLLISSQHLSQTASSNAALNSVYSERHLLKAVEALTSRGLLGNSRQDYWLERQQRALALKVPGFALGEIIGACESCPFQLKQLLVSSSPSK